MARILLIYSSIDGHTREICERLVTVIESQGDEIALVAIEQADAVDLTGFDKVVIGAAIRYGKHNKRVYDYIAANKDVLDSKSNAFFSVNVVARKPDKCQPDTNPYVKKFLGQIRWRPQHVMVFAGKIDYPRYGFWDRNIIRFIMWMTKGPTDPKAVVDFTDWEQVDGFGRLVSDM